jgi:hypothetical protein
MGDQSKHIDGKKYERKGWFQKKEDGNTIKYRETCKDGYYDAPSWDAHHVIPQTSIWTAVDEVNPAEKRRYIEIVMFITDWNINDRGNMLGMPQFASYLFYYQAQDENMSEQNPLISKLGEMAKIKGYINTFNKASRALRQAWLAAGKSPEGYPIHRPVSWGHVEYNKAIKSKLKAQVWDPIQENKKKHKFDAKNVASGLNSISARAKANLRKRGIGANRKNWDKRITDVDSDWYVPFTMFEVRNPLTG